MKTECKEVERFWTLQNIKLVELVSGDDCWCVGRSIWGSKEFPLPCGGYIEQLESQRADKAMLLHKCYLEIVSDHERN